MKFVKTVIIICVIYIGMAVAYTILWNTYAYGWAWFRWILPSLSP